MLCNLDDLSVLSDAVPAEGVVIVDSLESPADDGLIPSAQSKGFE